MKLRAQLRGKKKKKKKKKLNFKSVYHFSATDSNMGLWIHSESTDVSQPWSEPQIPTCTNVSQIKNQWRMWWILCISNCLISVKHCMWKECRTVRDLLHLAETGVTAPAKQEPVLKPSLADSSYKLCSMLLTVVRRPLPALPSHWIKNRHRRSSLLWRPLISWVWAHFANALNKLTERLMFFIWQIAAARINPHSLPEEPTHLDPLAAWKWDANNRKSVFKGM